MKSAFYFYTVHRKDAHRISHNEKWKQKMGAEPSVYKLQNT